MSRRAFLRRTVALSLGTIAAGPPALAAAAPEPAPSTVAEPAPTPPHGAELRGMSLPAKDRSAEGRFGVMFKGLPPFAPSDALLIGLGQQMQEQPPDDPPAFLANDGANDNPNPLLTTGVTFLGQFIDHDITFDTTPLDLQQADPDAIANFRTPRYDLDAVYGRGPTQDPQLYGPTDRDKLRIVVNANGVEDVPRESTGKAIIADPRNDQHVIIVQLHVAFMKFHNKLVDYVRARRVPPPAVFEAARQLTRWHYQWLVIHDFLPRIVGQQTADQVYKARPGLSPVISLNYYKPTNQQDRPFMPVEFAGAAYRFRHSITRPRYTISDTVSKVPLFGVTPTDNNLNGSRPVPARLKIQWSKFFGSQPTARPVRKIDATLATSLFTLPSSVTPDDNPLTLLAVRNLLRGKKLGLPSGQEVTRRMGATVLPNTDPDPTKPQLGLTDPGWNGEAPLWFYILKEAELLGKTERLGPVGGRIVAEVLVGLLQRDTTSYLVGNPSMRPSPPIAQTTGQFTMVDVLKFIGAWS